MANRGSDYSLLATRLGAKPGQKRYRERSCIAAAPREDDAMSKAYPQADVRTNTPLPADFTVPQRHSDYTAQDHATWQTLFHRQRDMLHGRVVEEFFGGLAALNIAPTGIPDFADINRVLSRATGWTVVAVPGLVPDDVFFAHLAARRF